MPAGQATSHRAGNQHLAALRGGPIRLVNHRPTTATGTVLSTTCMIRPGTDSWPRLHHGQNGAATCQWRCRSEKSGWSLALFRSGWRRPGSSQASGGLVHGRNTFQAALGNQSLYYVYHRVLPSKREWLKCRIHTATNRPIVASVLLPLATSYEARLPRCAGVPLKGV